MEGEAQTKEINETGGAAHKRQREVTIKQAEVNGQNVDVECND